ncbi:acyltransferase [Aeromicrobium sp. NPDC092404]|uniref:acyltransferase family protein n=1 Tax=Aeromicrobium sp. NPDC092404 TaxID=3154976 RepID=UPI00342F7A45
MTDSKREIGHAPSWGKRLAGLDGLRGLALLAVILAHTIILLPGSGGYSAFGTALTGLMVHGLTFFFVLSAFLLYRPFASAAIQGRTRPPTREFYRNRILRVWPAYLVIFAIVTWGFGLAVVDNEIPGVERLGRMTDPVDIILNLLLLQNWWPGSAFTGLSVSWSLVTEVSFYAMLPVLGAIAIWFARRGRPVVGALVPAGLMLLMGLCGRLITMGINGGEDIEVESTWLSAINRSIIGQGDLFGLGMIIAVLIVVSDRLSEKRLRTWRIAGWATVFVACVAVLGIGSGEYATPFMGVIFACILLLTQMPKSDAFSRAVVRVMETPLPRLAGEYSLSAYLWHYPVIWFLYKHVGRAVYDSNADIAVSFAIVLVPTVILGAITYHLVEKPAMSKKRRTDRRLSEANTAP